jgi:hypothetical protein
MPCLTVLGPIEKGASDGQLQYAKDIFVTLLSAVSTKRSPVAPGKGDKKGKGKKRRNTATDRREGRSSKGGDGTSDLREAKKEDWGLLEPLHGPLGPIVDIFKPLMTGNLGFGIVVFLVLYILFRQSRIASSQGSADSPHLRGLGTPERIAAYEEIWRREESELWDWLEDRIGLEDLHSTGSSDDSAARKAKRKENLMLKNNREAIIGAKAAQESMSEREIDEAIRVTEERLEALKGFVEKHKGERSGKVGTEKAVVPNETSAESE